MTTVTSQQVQLHLDELGVTGSKEIQPLYGFQQQRKHNCKNSESAEHVFDQCMLLFDSFKIFSSHAHLSLGIIFFVLLHISTVFTLLD